MRTVGQILKEERERKIYTLDEVEKATKIRKELLEALEKDEYSKLPPPTFVQGFIKNYGKFLGLDTEKLLAIYRREFAENRHPPRIMEAWKNPLKENKFHLTPSKVLGGVVLILVALFFGYLWIEYRFLVGAPFLEVTQPQDQISVESEIVKVEGKTDPEAKVSINDQEIQVDFTGKFSQEVKISDSVNKLVIKAVSKSDQATKIERTTEIERTVYLKR